MVHERVVSASASADLGELLRRDELVERGERAVGPPGVDVERPHFPIAKDGPFEQNAAFAHVDVGGAPRRREGSREQPVHAAVRRIANRANRSIAAIGAAACTRERKDR